MGPGRQGSAAGHRRLLTTRTVTWSLVVVASRLPVAMTPLALVFLVRERPGGYAAGAALGTVYVVGEIVGASVLGARLRPGRERPALIVGLLVGAAAFATIGLAPTAPLWALGAVAAVAGLAPAPAPGGLRSLLVAPLPEELVVRALGLESVLTYATWSVSPALVAVLALGVTPAMPLLLAALLMAASTAGLATLRAGPDAGEDDRRERPGARVLARAWPVYLVTAAANGILALLELVLPALLEQRGLGVGWAGPLLTGFAVASAAGAVAYGRRRRWPGTVRVQSLVLLLGVLGCVAVVASTGSLPVIAAGLLLAGLLAAGVQLTRALSLRDALPHDAHAAAYSVMYAAGAIGYAGAGSVAGATQRVAAPSVAVLVGVALTLGLGVLSALGELRGGRRVTPTGR